MNTVVISGRFVYEPELRQTNNGTSYISTRIAVSRNDKNRTTDFFNIKIWNNTAKFVSQYFHKGDPIEIRGRLETSERTDSEGRKSTEVYILVDETSFCLKSAERTEPTVAETAPTVPSMDMVQSVAELIDGEPGVLPFEL